MGDVFKSMMAVAHCGTRGHEGDDLRALLVELRAVLDREGWDFQPTADGVIGSYELGVAAGEAKMAAEVRAMVEECLRRAVEDAEAVDPNTDKYMREERDDHVDDFRALLAQLPGDDKPEEPKP